MFQYDRTDSKSVARYANCADELLYSSTGQIIWYGHVTEGVRFCKVSAKTALSVIDSAFLQPFEIVQNAGLVLDIGHCGAGSGGSHIRRRSGLKKAGKQAQIHSDIVDILCLPVEAIDIGG
eukprot:2130663-Rhodomonas_salina.2